MLRNKHIEEEIWKLKNIDKPIIKEKVVPPSLMDSPLEQRNLKDDRIFRLASESPAEEFEMEFNSLLKEFKEWKEKNKGTFKDFLKSNKDDVKVIKISKILADRKVAKDGGLIDKTNKPKEPAGVKEIDLMGDFHNLMDMLKNMSPQQRRSIQWLVDKTFGKKK